MYARQQIQKKASGTFSSTSTHSSTFKSRPFADENEQAASSPAQAMPDLQAQIERATQFGHHLSRMQVHADAPATIQTKLTIGAPGDRYEQEADAVADRVMNMSAPANQSPVQREMAPEEEEIQAKPLAASITPLVQREMMPEEEELQAKPLVSSIQREMMPEEEELQAKPLAGSIQREMGLEEEEVQAKSSPQPATTSGDLETQLNNSKSGGSPLPNEVRTFMEPRFGADFSQVRVHTDSNAVQMNQSLGAQAFTHGSDIYYGAGKSADVSALTAHELTHYLQQTS